MSGEVIDEKTGAFRSPFERLRDLTEHNYGSREKSWIRLEDAERILREYLAHPAGVRALAIEAGKPLIRQSFPGPEAHKLTVEQYALELGKLNFGVDLGLIETTELETIDSHLPKVRFDARFEDDQ